MTCTQLNVTRSAVLVLVLAAIFTTPGLGQTYQVIHNFGAPGDGEGPGAGMTFDRHGNLFGITYAGGTGCTGSYTCGTVFELSPNGSGGWNETVIHNFGATDAYPDTPLAIDAHGNLYGTSLSSVSYSVVYEVSPGSNGSWTERILHSFSGSQDGRFPEAGLTLDPAGFLYSTTLLGGENNLGTVYAVDIRSIPHESVIHAFAPSILGGANPGSTFLQEINGSLYGTTEDGGPYNSGTVFRLTPSQNGWTATTLYAFKGNRGGNYDGIQPWAGVIADSAGNLYGTTVSGGSAACHCGTVYKLAHNQDGSWTESVLYSFQNGSDGNGPFSNLVFDRLGNLYGTTIAGGGGPGTVYKLIPGAGGQWTESVLARLPGGPGGSYPFGGVVVDNNGNVFGTAQDDGAYGGGVAFEITP